MNTPDFDKIIIRELSVHAKIGYSSDERAFPQRLLLDIELGIGPWQPGSQEGDLGTTICYSTVKDLVEKHIQSKKWILLEELTNDICSLIFEKYALARQIKIVARKFVVSDTKWVGIEIIRNRP